MNPLVSDFYRGGDRGPFYKVIPLHSEAIDWEEALQKVPTLPRGWYELSSLTLQDRIEFTGEFWKKKLPYIPQTQPFWSQFFSHLDDVGVFLLQEEENEPFVVEMVYSLSSGASFFRAAPPCLEEELISLSKKLPRFLPKDFIQFFQIHNGFRKYDDTGLIKAENLFSFMEEFQKTLKENDRPIFCGGVAIDPSYLIPFYECFGLHSYQCFFTEWYPDSEMGNVYFSGIDYTISDYRRANPPSETLAFPTFLEWLAFYLEGIPT